MSYLKFRLSKMENFEICDQRIFRDSNMPFHDSAKNCNKCVYFITLCTNNLFGIFITRQLNSKTLFHGLNISNDVIELAHKCNF